MAKCLRCGAGNEWIQGRVPDESPSPDVVGDNGLNEMLDFIEGACVRMESSEWIEKGEAILKKHGRV